LTVKKNMHLILNSSTGTLVTVAISTVPDGGFHCESMSSQAKPAHIPHNMLKEIKVQIARSATASNPTFCEEGDPPRREHEISHTEVNRNKRGRNEVQCHKNKASVKKFDCWPA